METPSTSNPAPRVFLSYSWSSPAHTQWVLDLATRLRGDGVDVILDKWHLHPGHDKYAFMQQMANAADKVVVICDEQYARKADNYKGGVGTEAQIMSPEIYENVEQTKFIPVVCGYNDKSEPWVPVFLRARIYIDMHSPESESANYPALLRAIFERRSNVPPPLGKPPEFITNPAVKPSPTMSKLRMFKEAAKTGSTDLVRGTVRDYLEGYLLGIDSFLLTDESETDFFKSLSRVIDPFIAYRDEFIDFCETLGRYCSSDEAYEALFDFLQELAAKSHREVSSELDRRNADPLGFITYELFVYTCVVLLKNDRAAQLGRILERRLYFGDRTRSFRTLYYNFRYIPEMAKHRIANLNYSYVARLFSTRLSKQYKREQLIQADIILALKGAMATVHDSWYPALLCDCHYPEDLTFDILSRLASKRYAEKLRAVLQADTETIRAALESDIRRQGSFTHKYAQTIKGIVEIQDWDTQP